MLRCVEGALLKMVRHAGDVSKTPQFHWAEGSGESPHFTLDLPGHSAMRTRALSLFPLQLHDAPGLEETGTDLSHSS